MQTILKGTDTTFIKAKKPPMLEKAVVYEAPKKSKSKQTVFFANPPAILSGGSVVAKRESLGPVGDFFDLVVDGDKHKKNFEQAESAMLKDAIEIATFKAKIELEDIDMLLAGDLLNQITSSSYTARDLQLPFMGLYSACATFCQSLAIGACMLDAGYFKTIACASVSHFATAERQYRNPLEYGAQRPPFAQWTVTGAGCAVLVAEPQAMRQMRNEANEANECAAEAANDLSKEQPFCQSTSATFGQLGTVPFKSTNNSSHTSSSSTFKGDCPQLHDGQQAYPRITSATFGKPIDFGIDDAANMGAAMAPAALDTLKKMLIDTGYSVDDFDLIVTGDLGKLGSDILRDIAKDEGIVLGQNYTDCGTLIYNKEQGCYQGGSGAGCSAAVFNGFLLDRINSGVYRRVALLATGALMSPMSNFQGETIPSICHGVVIERSGVSLNSEK